MDLLLSDNYEEFLSSTMRKKMYPRIKCANLSVVLEKLKHDKGMFSKSTAEEKARNKSIDKVLGTIKDIGGLF
jgi:hypothetical protein